jgi:hypothetical protein
VGVGCPQLGNFRAGLVAQSTSPMVSAVSGGLSVLVGAAVIGLAFPALYRYRPPAPAVLSGADGRAAVDGTASLPAVPAQPVPGQVTPGQDVPVEGAPAS